MAQVLGVMCQTVAFQNEKAGVVGMLQYMMIIYSVLVDLFLF
jgi:hypothetical protein